MRWSAWLTGLLGAPVILQVLVAAGASVAMLALVRPSVVKRLHTGPDLQLGHGKLVGQRGVVTERITYDEHGRIRLAGEIWSAAPYDETPHHRPGGDRGGLRDPRRHRVRPPRAHPRVLRRSP